MDQPTIQIPHDIFDEYQQLADIKNRLLDEVASDVLRESFDKQLWAIVEQRLPAKDEKRLHKLLSKNSEGRINDKERTELDKLISEVNRQMLERSKALALLQERGYDIKGYLGLRDANP